MSEQPLISVIVPIYKVESYLDRCVQSIVNQTYENLEIILVDDGSPDNCPTMCDAWAAKDGRVQVIHKENGGVSTARNAGISIARGVFFAFVDSDDWIAPNMIRSLLDLQKESQADVTGCCLETVCEGDAPLVQTEADNELFLYSFLEIVMNNFPHDAWSLCAKLYRADLFDRVPRDLPSHLVMSEDIMLNTFLYKNCKRIALSDCRYYYYFRDGNSAISGELKPQMVRDCETAYSTMLSSIDSNDDVYGYMMGCKIQNDYFLINSIIRNQKCMDQYARLRHEILQNLKLIFDKKYAGIFSIKQRFGTLMLAVSPTLYKWSILFRRKVRGY